MIIALLVATVVVNMVVLRLQVRRRMEVVAATREMNRAALALVETAHKAIVATGTEIVLPSDEQPLGHDGHVMTTANANSVPLKETHR
jgi:hypothetical protein